MVRTAVAMAGLITASLATPALAERITIREWLPTTDGYAEFLEIASAEFKKSHPDVDIVVEDFPAEAYKTAVQVGLAAPIRPMSSSTGRARGPSGWSAAAGFSTSPISASRPTASSSNCRPAGSRRSRSTANITARRPTTPPNISTTT
jgi:hypothetical protein